jgi:hypothetical protein
LNSRRAALRLSALLLVSGAGLGLAPNAYAATPTDPYGYADARLCGTNDFTARPDIWTFNEYSVRVIAGRPGHRTVNWGELHKVTQPKTGTEETYLAEFSVSC